MTITQMSITVFFTQLVFLICRTWNVKAIAKQNIPAVLISGAVVHISWLTSMAIGGVSMFELLQDFQWGYVAIVLASLSGGTLGSYLGMLERGSNKYKVQRTMYNDLKK